MRELGKYLRFRAQEMELSLAEVSRRSGVSRQTLQNMSMKGGRLPDIDTLVRLASSLRVHPLRLVHLVFEDYELPKVTHRQFQKRGDRSAFIADVTVPDGEQVLAGSRFTKVWEMQNVGTVPWEGRFLACMDEEVVVSAISGERLRIAERLKPDASRVPIPRTAPGAMVRISVNFTAPTLPGSCVSYWKSVHTDGTLCFPNATGLSCVVQVVSMRTAGGPMPGDPC